jgi:outer membrane autotransporter protein
MASSSRSPVSSASRCWGRCTRGSATHWARTRPAQADGWGNSAWGRFVGQEINNCYQAFANPSASGQEFFGQAGIDLLRGSFWPGQRDAAGVYFAYGTTSAEVNGLVTNAAATGYAQGRTGTVNLNAYSGGVYWTHYGPAGWYVDAVFQGTEYTSQAQTQFANLQQRLRHPAVAGSGLSGSAAGALAGLHLRAAGADPLPACFVRPGQ